MSRKTHSLLSARVIALFTMVALSAFFTGCTHHQAIRRADHPATGQTHVVEKGDTLFALSKLYGVSVEDIMKANELDKNASLHVGQPIFIPGADSKVLSQKARDRLITSEKSAITPEPDDGRTIALAWPVQKGVLFRTFDVTPTRLHEGLSIGAPNNTPVFAAQDGEVIFASDANNHFGKMVIIKHAEPFVSIYAHLGSINVAVGKKVKKGETLGTVGSTGGVESPRVYFQLRKNRTPVNPELYLSKSS